MLSPCVSVSMLSRTIGRALEVAGESIVANIASTEETNLSVTVYGIADAMRRKNG